MTPNLLSGKELKRLSAVLNERIASIAWLFGFSSAQWVKNANREKGELAVQHSLMIRLLLDRPDLSPIPQAPLVSEVFEMLKKVDPNIKPNHLSTLVGLSPKSTARIFGDTTPTSTVGHMLLIIKTELERLKTKEKQLAFYNQLKANVASEAEARGYQPKRVWDESGWSVNSN